MSSTEDREEWQRMVGEDLKELLDLVEESRLEELEVADGERAIKIRVDRSAGTEPVEVEPAPVETPDPIPESEPSMVAVTADRVGTFYRSAEMEGAPLKAEGDLAEAGEAVAFIDSLNILHELIAPSGGRIVSFGVEDGIDVEYGEEVAVIEPEQGEPEVQG